MSNTQAATLTQYLTFTLGDEVFAFDVGNVREVLEMVQVTRVPRTPDYMSGIINVRGSVVPVIDLRLKMGMAHGERTVNTCIIVIEVAMEDGQVVLGALVDSVQEVVEFDGSQVEGAPKIGTGDQAAFLKGIGKREGKFVLIMDTARVVSEEELMAVAGAADVAAGQGSRAEK